MDDIVFDKRETEPTKETLKKTLKDSWELYESLLRKAKEAYPDMQAQWKFYSKKAGWTQKFNSKKTTMFYVIPRNGIFKVSLGMGQKAYERALVSDLKNDTKEILKGATPYVEGRQLMLTIESKADVEEIFKALIIKFSK